MYYPIRMILEYIIFLLCNMHVFNCVLGKASLFVQIFGFSVKELLKGAISFDPHLADR